MGTVCATSAGTLSGLEIVTIATWNVIAVLSASKKKPLKCGRAAIAGPTDPGGHWKTSLIW